MAGTQAGSTDLPVSTVRRAAQMCGLKEVGEDEEWTVYWTDSSVSLERVMDMKRFQVPMSWPSIQNEHSHPVRPGTGRLPLPIAAPYLYRQGGHPQVFSSNKIILLLPEVGGGWAHRSRVQLRDEDSCEEQVGRRFHCGNIVSAVDRCPPQSLDDGVL